MEAIKLYVEQYTEISDTDNIQVDLFLYNELQTFTIDLSKLYKHKDKYTFLLNNKDYFGNGCKYRNKQECLDFIKSNFREQLREGILTQNFIMNEVRIDLFLLLPKFVNSHFY